MKKFLTFTTLLLLSFILVACSNNKSSSSSSSFQTSTNSSSSSTVVQGMDLDQIASGDYSSIQGTWENRNGERVTITGNTVTGPGVDGNTVTLTNGLVKYNVAFVKQSGLRSSFDANEFIFAAAGTSPTQGQGLVKDGTDTTRDRFIWSTNGGTSLFNENSAALKSFYYRVE